MVVVVVVVIIIIHRNSQLSITRMMDNNHLLDPFLMPILMVLCMDRLTDGAFLEEEGDLTLIFVREVVMRPRSIGDEGCQEAEAGDVVP